jgi:hypothetical protein
VSTRGLLPFVGCFEILGPEVLCMFIIDCMNVPQSVAALVNMLKCYTLGLKQNTLI